GHPDHAEHPQRRPRGPRCRAGPDRFRRLGARRRDGQPLRPQPDLRPGHGRGARPVDGPAAGRAPDDRRRRPQRRGVRRGGRGERHVPRGGRPGPGAAGAGDPVGGCPRVDGAAARDPGRALRGAAARARHAADHDRRAGLRRADVPRPVPAEDPHGPAPDGEARRPDVAPGRRGSLAGDHRALRRGRCRRLRRGLRGLLRRRPRRDGRRAARPGAGSQPAEL
ncbi:MAG: Ribulose-phosphate 3-epimerase, partial [uncultured Nocardioides sp.]